MHERYSDVPTVTCPVPQEGLHRQSITRHDYQMQRTCHPGGNCDIVQELPETSVDECCG